MTNTATAQPAIDIGCRLEPLIDDHLIASLDGDLGFRLSRPHPAEIALVMDRPWELGSTHHGYPSIWRDGDRYAAWGLFEVSGSGATPHPETSMLVSEGSRGAWTDDTSGQAEHRHKRFRRWWFRPNGFVALAASRRGGTITTRPLRMDGTRLLLNCRTGAAGGIRVGMEHADGRPIPGHTDGFLG